MKKLMKVLFWYLVCDALLLGFAGLIPGALSQAAAQTILSTTTLSAAVPNSVSSALTTGNQSIVTVASATGISAPAPNTSNTYGVASSDASTYLYGGVDYGMVPAVPAGSCTRTNELFLPRIQFISGLISDCLGGQWVNGDALQTTRVHSKSIYAPNPGGTIYTSLNSTGTAPVSGTLFCTEIQLPYSKLATGLSVLNGTVVGTDNHLVALYDGTGNLLANSATAGALAASASEYQNISFTAPYFMVGPAQYFGCVQSNGTTATVRMLVTQVQDNFLTKSIAGTFGTVPATITVPTTFTTAVGPYFAIF
jgi:hypothetical protein